MSIYYHPDGSPGANSPSPYSSPYLIPSSHTPYCNPIPLPPVSVATQPMANTTSLAADTDFTAHKLLAFSAEDPAIAWDVRLPIDTVRVPKRPFRPPCPEQLAQHAVSPPWTFIRLRSALLPWTVECTNPAGVTVGDVLAATYDCLRQRVEKAEWHDASGEFQKRLLDAWQRRCVVIGDKEGRLARAREEKKGIRRVEWLIWDIEWLGMERSKTELETWNIHFRSR